METLQLLWINLVTDSIPAIMLAFEKPDKDIMENTPSNRGSQSFFTPFLSAKIAISALFKSVVMILLYIYYSKTYNVHVAGSLMFIFLIANELLYSFSCRDLKHSILNKTFFDNKRLSIGVGIIILLQIIIFSTDLAKFFIVGDISIQAILITLGICIITFIIGEVAKPIYAKYFKDYVEEKNEK